MAEEGHSLIPLPAWARMARQLQTPLRVYQEQLVRLYEPLQRYQRQLQEAYGPMFRYWERFIYWERSFGVEFGLPERQDPTHEQAWWPAPFVVSSGARTDRDVPQRALVPRGGPDATVASAVAASGNGQVDTPPTASAETEGPSRPDELRRQLTRIEERLREMGHLEEEVEDLLRSIRAELNRRSVAATRGSTRG